MKTQERDERIFLRFLQALCRLEPVEFFGIAKLLSVDLKDAQGGDKETETILSDILDGFIKADYEARENLLKCAEACLEEEKKVEN